MAIDAEPAMREYLAFYYRLGNRTGRVLDRFGVTDFATTIAPGLRDVLLTGKVYEAVVRNSRNKNARRYDAVVLDAPPTGRIAQFLNVNSEVGELARVGMLKGQSDRVMGLFTSPRTAVHLVTVLEDMPVQETADGIADLRAHRLPVGAVVVNLTRPKELDAEARDAALDDRLPRAEIESDLTKAGIDVSPVLLDGLLEEAHDHAERRRLEDQQRRRITELDVPTYELERIAGGVDLGALYELAAELREQGMA
jgi:anion-transporting  ArsA/GET3 family ATPase